MAVHLGWGGALVTRSHRLVRGAHAVRADSTLGTNLYVELDVSTLPVACDRCFIRGVPHTVALVHLDTSSVQVYLKFKRSSVGGTPYETAVTSNRHLKTAPVPGPQRSSTSGRCTACAP